LKRLPILTAMDSWGDKLQKINDKRRLSLFISVVKYLRAPALEPFKKA